MNVLHCRAVRIPWYLLDFFKLERKIKAIKLEHQLVLVEEHDIIELDRIGHRGARASHGCFPRFCTRFVGVPLVADLMELFHETVRAGGARSSGVTHEEVGETECSAACRNSILRDAARGMLPLGRCLEECVLAA